MGGTLDIKRVLLLFGAVLIAYLIVFSGIECWRRNNGPWLVQFNTNAMGQPFLLIEQQKRNLHGVRVVLAQETVSNTNLPVQIAFDRPRLELPFGRRLHEDLVQLPGVETFELFGHVVELAPRRLALNGTEIPWQSDQTYTLWPTNKPPVPVPPARSLEDTR